MGKPTNAELTESLELMTVRAEAAEAKLTEGGEDSGDAPLIPMPDGGWKLPGGEDTTDDLSEWLDALVSALDEAAAAEDEDDRMSKEDQIALQQELETAKAQLGAAQDQVRAMRSQLGSMKLSGGKPTPMSYVDVQDVLASGKPAKFIVLQEYKFMGRVMAAGREIRAQHYPEILSYVKNGLQLTPSE